jgi:hypothetical protein
MLLLFEQLHDASTLSLVRHLLEEITIVADVLTSDEALHRTATLQRRRTLT